MYFVFTEEKVLMVEFHNMLLYCESHQVGKTITINPLRISEGKNEHTKVTTIAATAAAGFGDDTNCCPHVLVARLGRRIILRVLRGPHASRRWLVKLESTCLGGYFGV